MAIATRQARTFKSVYSLPRHRYWGAVSKFVRTQPLGAAGAMVILLMAIAGLCADFIAPYDAYEIDQRLQFAPPGVAHWFGTDEFGRDVFTRIIYGARIALFVGFAASLLGATAGTAIGVLSAYLGGKIDLVLQRVMDVLLAFPLLVLALAIVSVLGRSLPNLIVAIAIPIIPRTARIVRASTLAAKENVYVESARAVGSSHLRVMWRHIVPNIMAPFLIIVTAQLGSAILTEASLSFLGLGTAEPTPSWGLMLSGGAPMYAEKAPWLAIFPGLAISLAVFGFNLLGDSLRDTLDPKLRHRT
jgi:peptide/nickel transport system permease protein